MWNVSIFPPNVWQLCAEVFAGNLIDIFLPRKNVQKHNSLNPGVVVGQRHAEKSSLVNQTKIQARKTKAKWNIAKLGKN